MKLSLRSSAGIHPELLREDVHAALDRVRRLGHAERAAIRDSAWRLVREIRVDFGERVRKVVRTGHDAEHAGRILAGSAAASNAP